MTNTQITLIQIDNYGPWTVTPEPRREVDLQTLQSRLYADLAQLVGTREGYVFFTRFDNMVAVTNGLDMEDHGLFQESIANRYPVTVSLSVATGDSPGEALGTASERLQRAGSAQDDKRRGILRGQVIGEPDRTEADLRMAHFDVNDATGKYTDRLSEFDSFVHIQRGYTELMRYMYEEHDALSFFVGGDNVITTCPTLESEDYWSAVEHVRSSVDVELKVGVGRGRSAQRAGMTAKHALETCRDGGSEVELAVE